MEREECKECILKDSCNNKYDYGLMALGRAGFDEGTNASVTQELYNQPGATRTEVQFDMEMGPRIDEIDISTVGEKAGKALNRVMKQLSKSLSR